MRHRISPATIIACVALYFSLAGASFAAGSNWQTFTHGSVPSGDAAALGLPVHFARRTRVVATVHVRKHQIASAFAACPYGMTVASGHAAGNVRPTDNFAPPSMDGWIVSVAKAPHAGLIRAVAVCH